MDPLSQFYGGGMADKGFGGLHRDAKRPKPTKGNPKTGWRKI